ncbi:hypothetical protein HDU93_004255, partial [Gonapodya sp. JEL0774]
MKSGAKAVAKKGRKKKGDDTEDGRDGRVPSLRSLCIKIAKLICDNIEDVEEFGDIPQPVKIRIGQILSKHRTLSTSNVRLFLTPTDDAVKLTDCTRVDDSGLRLVAAYAPNVRVLELGFCGQMTDEVLDLICEKCPFIEEIHLQGPFLVTDKAISNIFLTYGRQLKKFSLEDSPNITTNSILSLTSACHTNSPVLGPAEHPSPSGLSVVRLIRCDAIDDTALLALTGLGCSLDRLELVGMNEKKTTDRGAVAVLEALGGTLKAVDLSWNATFGDPVALA